MLLKKRWSIDPAQTASTLIKGLTQRLISIYHIDRWNKIDEHRLIWFYGMLADLKGRLM